ncbi:hypothetical protein HTY52_08145 [Cupriavidus taiwanensis]|uniref:hypothetical protein n=1 Tax=Cupriavidus taiwanensis TaxID=164546 RepID=UPI001573F929|nr:hypothetical protein [Cupriavidus taiwanensis]NSX14041.1 hypothetical protein [Cupriavidus taiwanensis]
MSEQSKERDAFEAWLPGCWPKDSFVDQEGDELYAEEWVQGAWIGWQARATGDVAAMVASQSAEPVVLLQAILDEIGSEFFNMLSAGTWLRVAEAVLKTGAVAYSAATGAHGSHELAFILNVLEDVRAAMPPTAAHRITTGKAIEKLAASLAQAAPSASEQQARDVVTRDDVVRWAKFAGIEPFLTERGYERLADFAIAARRAAANAPSASPAPLTDATYQWQAIDGKQHDTGRVTDAKGSFVADTASLADARMIAEALNARSILAASPAPAQGTQAWRDVLAERQRQISAEGWTPEHDDEHDNFEMAYAAACYAMADDWPEEEGTPEHWPWAPHWWKPKGARQNLVRAGALILAEIERRDRAAMIASKEGQA